MISIWRFFILSRRVPFCPEKRNANKSFFAQTEESSGNGDSPLKTTHCTWKERCHERNNLPSAAEDLNIDSIYYIPIRYINSYPCLPMAGCQRWTFSYLATLPHYWNASNPGDQFWSLIVLIWYNIQIWIHTCNHILNPEHSRCYNTTISPNKGCIIPCRSWTGGWVGRPEGLILWSHHAM